MEVTYCFCDKCNPEQDTKKVMAKEAILGLGMAEDQLAYRGFFEGTQGEAMSNGWTEEDFGFVCPICVFEEKRIEATGETVVGIDELRDALAKE